ncbi:MAG: inorganic phosphate transporter [Bdellovibrionaceae bacterium]|nr:inorganic phosphate transporter [Bdellovibrionales bacterium]MCB9083237.1 inorganic phosphate transporter [Pseudobdellovibrionaceae bacterium]
MLILFGIVVGLILAYANGANDNFKGVATLYGSKTTSYRGALALATIATLAGSILALFIAKSLLVTFSGKGIVPNEVASLKEFSLAVGLGAGLTVLLATRLGFPISTTHALTGAMTGVGLVASFGQVSFTTLGSKVMLPLLISPVLAVVGTILVYPALRRWAKGTGVKREICLCVGKKVLAVAPAGISGGRAEAYFASQVTTSAPLALEVGLEPECRERYVGQVFGFNAGNLLDGLHYLSAGAVSFARGLNDTPKIAAILLVGQAFSMQAAILAVGVAIAVGGLLNARRVAETMSEKVTEMNTSQGLVANLVTSGLVIVASKFGLPVSTTHVSCSSLFGIGLATGQAHKDTIKSILLAWVITLPIAAVVGVAIYLVLRQVLPGLIL